MKKELKNEIILSKSELVKGILQNFDVSVQRANDYIDTFFEEVSLALAREEDVKFPGLGTFSVKNKKERIGRNPNTMEEAVISARKAISFKTSSLLKNQLNEGK